jgi:aryl-alcohol dehydrogenase
MLITAAVAREKFGAFTIEELELAEPRPDELLVRIVASGMCQTDQHGRDGYYGTPLPAVFGHEGAGVVAAVGSAVTQFAPGDHVVLSFPWCGACPSCRRRMEAHCHRQFDLKMRGTRPDGSTLLRRGTETIYSAFFQQSSFGTHAIANERFAVKVRKDAPLELLGPFACSGQTGAGAVLNSMKPEPGDAFAVFGVGAVGLSGLMAAKMRAAIRLSQSTSTTIASRLRASSARPIRSITAAAPTSSPRSARSPVTACASRSRPRRSRTSSARRSRR